jgi:hypothetical protein
MIFTYTNIARKKMDLKRFVVYISLLACVSLFGCTSLSTQWSENFALATHGTKGNHPALNDGNLETIAAVPAKNERVFTLKFPDVRSVRKIVIHNGNLFRFEVDYLDTKTDQWKTIHSVRQRRDIQNQNAQSTYVIDRLNFQTDMIQINVSRTVDDDIITKPIREPGDKVVDRRLTLGGLYYPHFRVVRPAWAQIREVQVYHLASK